MNQYPSHKLIELDLYDTNGTSDVLYDLFRDDADVDFLRGNQIASSSSSSCWGKSNAHK